MFVVYASIYQSIAPRIPVEYRLRRTPAAFIGELLAEFFTPSRRARSMQKQRRTRGTERNRRLNGPVRQRLFILTVTTPVSGMHPSSYSTIGTNALVLRVSAITALPPPFGPSGFLQLLGNEEAIDGFIPQFGYGPPTLNRMAFITKRYSAKRCTDFRGTEDK